MWKVQICFNLFLLTVCAHNVRFFSNFTNKDTYPKCCDVTEALNKKRECVNVTEIKDFYQVSQINNVNPSKNDFYCVDAIVNEYLSETGIYQGKMTNNLTIILKGNEPKLEEVLFYPKCCPLPSIYDPKFHRCIPNENTTSMPLDTESWYVKTGLAQCRDNHVIMDYLLRPNEEIILHDNKSISLDGTLHSYGAYCFDKASDEIDVVRVCRPQEEVCLKSNSNSNTMGIGQTKRIRCIIKCCPDGHSYSKYNGKNQCMPNFKFGVDTSKRQFNYRPNVTSIANNEKDDKNELDKFAILTPPVLKRYLVTDVTFFYIDQFGQLFTMVEDELKKFDYNENKYCVEYHNSVMRFFFNAQPVDDEATANRIHAILLIISIVFITITITAYIFLPKMLNLHGKITLSHCLSLLLLDILLLILKVNNKVYGQLCVLLGFSVLFASLSVFCWLNIIGFDIWYNIGSMRVRGMQRKDKEIRKFIFYCGYGWIAPFVFTGFAFAAYSYQFLPDWATPHIGESICYFHQKDGTYDYFIFYFVPFNTLLIANLVFFGRTIYYCFKVKAEINRMRHDGDDKGVIKKMFEADKERAGMLFKLLVVMGVTWMLEIISLIVDFKYRYPAFLLTFDAINALQGFWIFCIYILKRKVYEAVQDTLGIKWGRRSVNRGSASDRTTTTHQIYISKTATPKDNS